jgi:two-component sensor histidine kinase/PAS domain-containing protein
VKKHGYCHMMINRKHWIVRYSWALALVAGAFLLRHGIILLVGGELPHWITFYPAIMLVALLAGSGPGVLAAITSVLVMSYTYFPPEGLGVSGVNNIISIAIFLAMGVFMSTVAGLYRRTRDRLEDLVAERTAELRRTNEELRREIVDRKQAEEGLRESRAKLEAALASMTDAVFISDAEGRFIDFNDSFATFHRFRNKDECARTFAEYPDILDVYMADGTLAPLEMWAVPRALRGETVTNAEYTLRRKDTGETWVGSYSFGPIRNTSGDIVGSVVAGRDITDHKKAEQALQKAHDELAKQVEERTRELREKEVLLKEVHHRVKNNLQVISSLVGLQADGSKDETVREVLKDVTYRVRSMALVHEKLYQSADLARIDFAEYARSLLGYLWRAHGEAAASVRLTLDLAPVTLPVDTAVPCGLMLNELAGNALKHAFQGRSEGEVTVSLHGPAEGRFSMCVRDDGVGLPDGFDWRQAGSLGLRLVQMLAGQLGAEVKVSCTDGAQFEIVI